MRALLTTVLCAAGIAMTATVAGCRDENGTGIYSGYYRQGFEQSDFYTLEGDGPWWVDAGEIEWDTFMAHMVPAPGRGTTVTLRMTVEGDLQTGGGYGHAGRYDKRLFVTRVVAIEPIAAERYDAAIAEFQASSATD
jgi:hypothetical protein